MGRARPILAITEIDTDSVQYHLQWTLLKIGVLISAEVWQRFHQSTSTLVNIAVFLQHSCATPSTQTLQKDSKSYMIWGGHHFWTGHTVLVEHCILTVPSTLTMTSARLYGLSEKKDHQSHGKASQADPGAEPLSCSIQRPVRQLSS